MTRITISDIPEDTKLSNDELRRVMGGGTSPSGLFEVGQQIGNPANLVSVGACCCCIFRNIPSAKDLAR